MDYCVVAFQLAVVAGAGADFAVVAPSVVVAGIVGIAVAVAVVVLVLGHVVVVVES